MYIMSKTLVSIFSFCFLSFGLIAQSGTVTDIDGNVYRTVKIGQDIWMAENLKTGRYNDGRAIQQVADRTTWSALSTGAWCWYSNDQQNEKPYGKLYNWYALAQGNICPTGWHIPSENEGVSDWSRLIRSLGGDQVAGGKLKARGSEHWLSPNVNATNSSGFAGLPGGIRTSDGLFDGIRFEGLWWSRSEKNLLEYTWSRSRNLFFDSARIDYFDGDKRMGLSVRCVKDR